MISSEATDNLVQDAAVLLGESVIRAQVLAGGDLSPVVSLSLTDGREVVAKGGPFPRIEGAMLQALSGAGAPVPRVLAVSERILVLERLAEGGGLAGSGWAELGTMLRALHSAPGAGEVAPYGWAEDYAFGSVAIPNAPLASWPDFWAERRLRPSLPALPSGLAHRVERVAADLRDRLPDRPFPALLHGDLWVGNVLASQGRLSGLIDPACYYGDAEVDLAMLHLFGAPGPSFKQAYGALEPGWEERRAVYQLWPALVHVRLFGAGYHGMLAGLLNRLGA
ncbi:fructosamine kinase family protein [Thioclava atlantica]|uniref:fructosamine kinase family protein n=1 Tax=Thioclava atlantica TaxID=1317124 RepID=UPI000A9C4A59